MNQGISTLQGPHHVAQKSRRMTFPLSALRATSFPVRSFSVKLRFAILASAEHPAGLAACPATGDTVVASSTSPTATRVQRLGVTVIRYDPSVRPSGQRAPGALVRYLTTTAGGTCFRLGPTFS